MRTVLTRSDVPDTTMTPPGSWLLALRAFCLVAFGLSAYVLWGSLTGERLPGCGLESGCATVLKSRWAYIFRVPVSLPALLLYASVLGSTVILVRARSLGLRQVARTFLICAAAAVLGAAAWFIGLQLFIIHAICPFCMAAHACGLAVGGLILAREFKAPTGYLTLAFEPSRRPVPLSRNALVLAGFAAVVLLIVGQLVDQPKMFAVDSAAKLAARKTPRIIQLHGGAFQLDLNNVPLLGSPEAPCVIVHLFDYSCPHCRQLHPLLTQLYNEMSNQVAIASLVVPLATNCNRVVKRSLPLHINACDYAYAGLAVWRANPAQLTAFEDWIYASNRPPSPEAVRAHAMRLVGTNQFQNALKDKSLTAQLERNISLYATNYYRFRKSVLPELMIGTNIISGVVRGREDLYPLVTNQFSLRRR